MRSRETDGARLSIETGGLRRQPGVVIASMLGVAFSVPTIGVTYSIGPFINPLIAEFGWTRQQILFVQTLVTLVIVIASGIIGWIADRYGVRRVILVSQALLGLGFFLLATRLESLASLYVIYVLLALGGGGTIGIGFTRLVAQRFHVQRGLALGIALSGSGVCGFIVPPYAAWAVQTFGWRAGYFALGLLPLCVALPLAWRYLHDEPLNAERQSGSPSSTILDGVSFSHALASYRFWALAFGLFLCSGMMTAFVTNIVPRLEESGFTAVGAGSIASIFGISVVLGRIAIGSLMDRFFAPRVGILFLVPAAAGVAILGLFDPAVIGLVVIVLIVGLAAGAEVDLMAYLTSRYFGLREYGKIFAAQYAAFALGPGLWVPWIGALRDSSGDYSSGFLVAASGIAIFALILAMLGPFPTRLTITPER